MAPARPAPHSPVSPAERLLRWYDAHRRDLPWRRSRDPYAIWVSEVMLQQTRVETVVPAYERFLSRFPSLAALASASEEEVLAVWSGLGYYRRARLLWQAARRVDGSGGLPRTAAELALLPGFGPYTAAAVASIAFGEPALVIDGNVERVLSRQLALREDPRRGSGRAALRTAGEALLDCERPGDSNQALMELGATVCLPRAPRCPECPLRASCAALAGGTPESYPQPRPRRPSEQHLLAAVVVERGGRLLLARRPGGAPYLAGMWELPNVAGGRPAPAVAAELAVRYGGRWRLGPQLARVRHTITYRRFEVEVWRGEWASAGELRDGDECGWFDAAARARLPLTALVDKALRRAVASKPEDGG